MVHSHNHNGHPPLSLQPLCVLVVLSLCILLGPGQMLLEQLYPTFQLLTGASHLLFRMLEAGVEEEISTWTLSPMNLRDLET